MHCARPYDYIPLSRERGGGARRRLVGRPTRRGSAPPPDSPPGALSRRSTSSSRLRWRPLPARARATPVERRLPVARPLWPAARRPNWETRGSTVPARPREPALPGAPRPVTVPVPVRPPSAGLGTRRRTPGATLGRQGRPLAVSRRGGPALARRSSRRLSDPGSERPLPLALPLPGSRAVTERKRPLAGGRTPLRARRRRAPERAGRGRGEQGVSRHSGPAARTGPAGEGSAPHCRVGDRESRVSVRTAPPVVVSLGPQRP